MKDRVQRKLDAIFSYPLFASVGGPLPDSVTKVKTWQAAVKECSTTKWENCQLMASNAVQRAIEKQYPKQGMWERSEEWNPLVQEIRPLIHSFIGTLLPNMPLTDQAKEKLKHNLSWDFLAICVECEFSDIVEPIFSIKYLEPWYSAGHFPCGWDGDEFPNSWDGIIHSGRLMVF